MLTAVVETFAMSQSPHALIKEIAVRFNALAAEDLGRPMSNKWAGGFLRRRLRLVTIKTGGVYAVPLTERAKCDALARRFGLAPGADSILTDLPPTFSPTPAPEPRSVKE